jgi:hypothetical protein
MSKSSSKVCCYQKQRAALSAAMQTNVQTRCVGWGWRRVLIVTNSTWLVATRIATALPRTPPQKDDISPSAPPGIPVPPVPNVFSRPLLEFICDSPPLPLFSCPNSFLPLSLMLINLLLCLHNPPATAFTSARPRMEHATRVEC